MMRRKSAAATLGSLVAALVLTAPSSFAASRGAERTAMPPDRPAATPRQEQIPFTALDLALIIGGGSGLLAVGAAVRRAATDRT